MGGTLTFSTMPMMSAICCVLVDTVECAHRQDGDLY